MIPLLNPFRTSLRPNVRIGRAVQALSVITVLILAPGLSFAAGPPVIQLSTVTAAVGGTLLMPVSFQASEGKGVSTLVLRLSIPALRVTLLDVIPDASVAASGKSLDFETGNNQLSICVFGGTSDITSGGLCLLLLRLLPDNLPGTSITVADVGTHGADKEASAVVVDVQEGVITAATGTNPHVADSNKDWSVSLPELLRIIQFYNVGNHHCDAATADGFAPGPGNTECQHHDADYTPADWTISFVELLRLIQLYNSPYGTYHVLAGTEDGFSPGPFGIVYDKRFARIYEPLYSR